MNETNPTSSATDHFQTFREYHGGGVILSPSTLLENVVSYCETDDLLQQVLAQFRSGREVIIHNGAIVASQTTNGGKTV